MSTGDVDQNVRHELLPAYTPRLDQAVQLVLHDFRRVTRKGSTVPYISHLFSVTALVAEAGGDEDQLISAMLHDWLEDVPESTPEELERRFGPRVRRIVESCTDTQELPKPPWRARKEKYLASLPHHQEDEKLVTCADKLHNAGTLVRDLRLHGPSTMDRFRGGRDGTLWYYASVADALGQGWHHWLLTELRVAVRDMHALAAE
ncbi:MAG: bifunctional (p)ppGpp synthetase/guanosine-3',5'-bis(diphosphate) 3'-pyrophosphohydrolase [Myxococcales bacterium]|nr:bifunctional (p)ppGpp synthetase/guanosine-3',5'-bis(diphosphate) 3'-pyrophosphohydrolase [Myxococcales bacterium]